MVSLTTVTRRTTLNLLFLLLCASAWAQDKSAASAPNGTNGISACATASQWYSQVNPAWKANVISGTCTIGNNGCVVTCIAMLLASTSGNTTSSHTPATLNTYLRNNSGYSGCSTFWAVAANADGSAGLAYYGGTSTANNWAWLDAQLAACRKVLVNVNNSGHWVLVVAKTGTSGVGSSYKVLDPGNTNYTAKTLASFGTTFSRGQAYAATWKTSMPYRLAPETPINEPFVEDYETHAEEGKDGALEAKTFTNVTHSEAVNSALQIYPNPIGASGSFVMEFEAMESQQTNLIITDLTGKMVYQTAITIAEGENSITVQTENLANGLYLVVLKTPNEIFTQKLQVQN
jgi:Secretion system C-terminal sorting domain